MVNRIKELIEDVEEIIKQYRGKDITRELEKVLESRLKSLLESETFE